MRTTKELLSLLLWEVISKHKLHGLCGCIYVMELNQTISHIEALVLEQYLDGREPWFSQIFRFDGYWWKPGRRKPRIKWLTKQIKKLS